jgi:hypothetical protein
MVAQLRGCVLTHNDDSGAVLDGCVKLDVGALLSCRTAIHDTEKRCLSWNVRDRKVAQSRESASFHVRKVTSSTRKGDISQQ